MFIVITPQFQQSAKRNLMKLKKQRHKKQNSYKNPKRYRLSFYNENTLNRVWSLSMSRRRLIFRLVICGVLLLTFMTFLIAVTPLKHFIPGTLNSSEKRNWSEASQSLDSIRREIAYNNLYLSNLQAILNDDVSVDSVYSTPTENLTNGDSLFSTSEAERNFVRMYEEREKYNLSVLTPLISEAMNFFTPVNGVDVIEGETPTKPKFILKDKETSIDAIYRGTVVDVYYTPSTGYVVLISHPGDFISRYGGMTSVFVDRGDKVKAGSRIGEVKLSDSPLQPDFTLEMWQNGMSLIPQDFIIF